MSDNLKINFLKLVKANKGKFIARTEGCFFKEEAKLSFESLLTSGYTLHLDLQNLSPEEKQKVWDELLKQQSLKKLAYNPFHYRRNTDHFGVLHEEYNISWLDWSGMLWSYYNQHWHKQAFHHPDNYHVFRSSQQPDLIMLRKLDVDDTPFKPTRNKNVISLQFFNKPIESLSYNMTDYDAKEYHEKALKKLTCDKALNCSSATLCALVIWFLFQYPPSTEFVLGLLAAIGIPFFPFSLALLGIISLASIVISIIINYVYTLFTPESDINFWQTLNKVMYNIAFFVIPLLILICVPAAVLNVNLLIIAGVAALFAIYHYVCLNNLHAKESETIVNQIASLFRTPNHEKPSPTHTSSVELEPIKSSDTQKP